MKLSFQKLLINLFCLLLIGCGDSFLLNKGDSSDSGSSRKPELEEQTFSRLGLSVRLNWITGPTLDGPSHLVFIVLQDGKVYTDNLKVEATLDMPEMNHDNYPITIKTLQPGIVDLSEIILFMTGLWHIKIKLTTDKNSEEVIWAYTL